MLRSLDWFPGRVLLSRAAYGHSTIGAEGLNCRVRDGNGCCPPRYDDRKVCHSHFAGGLAFLATE